MKAAFTPGPWAFVSKITANENQSGYFVRANKIKTNGVWSLALVQPGDDDGLVGEANARLIAAAPDLLAALQAFNIQEQDVIGGDVNNMIIRVPLKTIEQMALAVAKATGSAA